MDERLARKRGYDEWQDIEDAIHLAENLKLEIAKIENAPLCYNNVSEIAENLKYAKLKKLVKNNE